jgi:hypothetical protein
MKINNFIYPLILFSSVANADSGYFGFGLGAFNSARSSLSEVKAIQFGHQQDIMDGIYWQQKIGYWGDGSGDDTRKNSAYVSTGIGLLVDLRPLEIRNGWGLAVISTPDSFLGGHFPQFNGELYIGLRDKKGNGIGLQYEHLSSAGIVTPNRGRDFYFLQVSQSW